MENEDKIYKTVPIPVYLVNKLKSHWMVIYEELIKITNIELRMNLQKSVVEFQFCKSTKRVDGYFKRIENFFKAFISGFKINEIKDTLIYDFNLISFSISDVKKSNRKSGSRAIGRVIGTGGKTKKIIEETSGCKIHIKDEHVIYLLGTNEGIKIAKEAICRLIMGAQPGSIQRNLTKLRSKRRQEYFETIYLDK